MTVGVPPSEVAPARRRPLWVVVLLTFLSTGTYQWIWVWMSWRELKRLHGDAEMRPFWHSLSIYVPIYGIFRFHAHYRVLASVIARTGGQLAFSPFVIAIVWLVVSVIGWVYTVKIFSVDLATLASGRTPPDTLLYTVLASTVLALLVYVGQDALNKHYGAAVPERARTAELVFLGIFGLVFASQLASGVR